MSHSPKALIKTRGYLKRIPKGSPYTPMQHLEMKWEYEALFKSIWKDEAFRKEHKRHAKLVAESLATKKMNENYGLLWKLLDPCLTDSRVPNTYFEQYI